MDSAYIAIGVIAVALSAIFALSLLNRGAVRALMLVQTGYWTVSYLLRPGVLLAVQPESSLNDSLADPRYALLGYSRVLGETLPLIAFGLVCYTIIASVYTFIWGRFRVSVDGSSDRIVAVFVALFAVGNAARVLSISSGLQFLEVFTWFATAGSIGILTYWRAETKRHTLVVMAFVLLVQLWGSFESGSKTPLMAALVALVIRASLAGGRGNALRGLAVSVVAVVVSFPAIQAAKGGWSSAAIEVVDARYPPLLQPILPILRRFDLSSAVTDAYFAGASSWLNIQEYSIQAIMGFIPDFFGVIDKTNAGLLWARDVRPVSLLGANTEVSLADGFIAEGYVLAGHVGVLLQAVLIFAATIAVGLAVERASVFLKVWSALMLSFPILYERGSLGLLEVTGRSIFFAFAIATVSMLMRGLNSSSARSSFGKRANVA